MAKEQKQVCDIQAGKRMTVAQSNEHLRIGHLTAFNAHQAGNLDPTRTHLNFEIGKGGVVKEVDQKTSITKRIKDIYKSHGIVDPNAALSDEELKQKGIGRKTHANIILQGSRETMRKLAFGRQQVDYNNGADNTAVTRSKGIERWATDMYNFIAQKYGEQNIAAFVVHLDETNPHVHCTLLPITNEGKLSWKDFFDGQNKDTFKKHFKTLHDELAEINKKYGLKRGDSVARTGAQHKSYLQWLQEQIAANEGTLKEQRLQLYAVNEEIKIAEKKLKSFTTMLQNLKDQQEALEIDITALEAQRDEGDEEAGRRLLEAQEKLAEINGKISDREKRLEEVQQQLRDLAARKHSVQRDYENMLRQINKEKPEVMDKTQRDINASMWNIATEEMKKVWTAIGDFAEKLSPEQRGELNGIIGNSPLEEMAERGNEVAAVAAALFLGYVDAATNFARNSGGGGGSTAGWGRDKDEDDEAFRRRCCIMGRMMMRPSGNKIKRS